MLDLNYLHLKHFYHVASLESFTKASVVLKISQPTLSEQIKSLEKSIGSPLFLRHKGSLKLTEAGRYVFNEATIIFRKGNDLIRSINSGEFGSNKKLKIGVMNSIPKLFMSRLLKLILKIEPNVELEFQEHEMANLKSLLNDEKLDILISDDPAIGVGKEKFLNFEIGVSSIAIFKSKKYKMSLNSLPNDFSEKSFILPIQGSNLRSQLDLWFFNNNVLPKVVAEVSDTALVNELGDEGAGLFFSPICLSKELKKKYDCETVFEMKSLNQHFFLITTELNLEIKLIDTLLKKLKQESLFLG